MDRLKTLYSEVFNDDGSIKVCGRDKCKHLISCLSDMYPDKYFGDVNTGFLNIKAIREVMK